MIECNIKKILARRVFKIFSEMRSFLVERFTAKSFLITFLLLKSDSKIFIQTQNDKRRKTLSVSRRT